MSATCSACVKAEWKAGLALGGISGRASIGIRLARCGNSRLFAVPTIHVPVEVQIDTDTVKTTIDVDFPDVGLPIGVGIKLYTRELARGVVLPAIRFGVRV
jgi:hypothetical protein